MLLLLYLPLICSPTKEIEYRLSKNYGQLIYDFSGNFRHLSNGKSSSTTELDGTFTDRGFYVSGSACAMPLSSNPSMNIPNPGTALVWARTSSKAGRFIHQFINESNFVYYKKGPSNNILVTYRFNGGTLVTLNGASDSFLSSKIYLDTWVMISVVFSGRYIKVHQNLNLVMTLDYVNDYVQTYRMVLGSGLVSDLGTNSFFYYFAVFSSDSVHDKYIGTASSNCFTGDGTCGVCSYSIYLEFDDEYGCVSELGDSLTDATGSACSTGYSCRDGLSINCLCPSSSCYWKESKVVQCVQTSSGVLNRASINCDSVGQGCCFNICLECEYKDKCLSCVADYAFVDEDGLCTCGNGYYGLRPLLLKSSCSPCKPECKTCENDKECLQCLSENSEAYLSSCKCKDGYYQSEPITSMNSCKPCQSECKTCSSISSCDSCISDNSQLSSSGCKCEKGFFSSGPLTSKTSCEKCDDQCLTCIFHSNCETCVSKNAYPQESGCECEDGFFSMSSLITPDSCMKCELSCKKCRSFSECLECSDPNAQIMNGKCRCLQGYYSFDPMNTNICIKCSEHCNECDNFNQCLLCSDGFSLIDGICVCPESYWIDSNSNSIALCRKCNKSCKSCTSLDKCDQCVDSHAKPFKDGCRCNENYFNKTEIFKENTCETCNEIHSKLDVLGKSCICKKGFFSLPINNSLNCQNCQEFCEICFDSSRCEKCLFGFIYESNICKCQKGFSLLNDSCKQNFFNLSINVSNTNTLKLHFSENLLKTLTISDLNLEISTNPLFSFKIFRRSKKEIQIYLKFKESLQKNSILSLSFTSRPVFSSNYSELDLYEYQVTLEQFNFIEDSFNSFVELTLAFAKGVIISSVVSSFSDPKNLWNLLSYLQLIQFIPLGFARLTPAIKKLCKNVLNVKIGPNFFQFFMNSDLKINTINEITDSGMSSTEFWANSGKNFTYFICLLIFFPFFWCFSQVRVKWVKKKFESLSNNYKYSFFLRFWIQAYLELGVFSIVQFHSKFYIIISEPRTLGFYTNYVSSIVFLVIIIKILISITPFIILSILLLNEEKIKDSLNFEFKKRFGTLFNEFKTENGLAGLGFYFFFTFRRLLYIFGQVYLRNLTIVQISLQCFLTFVSFVYILKIVTFNDMDNKILNLLSELAVFICFGSVLVMNCFDPGMQDEYLEKAFSFTIFGYLVISLLSNFYKKLIMIRKLIIPTEKKRT